MKSSIEKRYVHDFPGFMSLCEMNYARMIRLFPDYDTVDTLVFGVSSSSLGLVRLTVIERCKYTTLLSMSQEMLSTSMVPEPVMTIRVYHDARMTEVISFQGQRNLKCRYDYPNKHMNQPDEKAQLNLFLAEWLDYCREHGLANHTQFGREYS